MSEATYGVRVIRNVRVPMRDGVELAADITRPDAEGRFPAVMAYLPYHKPGAAARSQCITTSDRNSFRHLVEVEVTVNGRPHFGKSWAVSVPRQGN